MEKEKGKEEHKEKAQGENEEEAVHSKLGYQCPVAMATCTHPASLHGNDINKASSMPHK